jgi:hypothetical protein
LGFALLAQVLPLFPFCWVLCLMKFARVPSFRINLNGFWEVYHGGCWFTQEWKQEGSQEGLFTKVDGAPVRAVSHKLSHRKSQDNFVLSHGITLVVLQDTSRVMDANALNLWEVHKETKFPS